MELPSKTSYWRKERSDGEDEDENVSNYWMIWRNREWELQEQSLDLTLWRAGFARGQGPIARLHDDVTYRGRGGDVHLYSAALSRWGKNAINPQKCAGDYSQGSKRGMNTGPSSKLEATSPWNGVLQFVNVSAVTRSDGLTNFGLKKIQERKALWKHYKQTK